MPPGYRIVAFSHLRWDFVYQRPQHLLSRLAERYPVAVIEEPLLDSAGPPRWERSRPQPNLTVYRPRTPVEAPGFGEAQQSVLESMLPELAAELGSGPRVGWFYTPMALPLAEQLGFDLAVYDCMDELSLFAGAPDGLLRREAELLDRADLVFTGGPSLYRAKRDRHPSVHCFPSSVDAAHFRQALTGTAEAPEQAGLPRPRLGFYGVIDERLDIRAIELLADWHPDWRIVLVGPIVKIDPATLPRRPNIHYFGQRSYADLPGFLAGWDVCLLPFARNDATKFISPTKTLEYMAAERPIVSTPITDVAEPYGSIVYLGDTPTAFVAACERALTASAGERARRTAAMRQVLAGTSWDTTAAAMNRLIAKAFASSPAVA
jgi:UDP-galactopyranose mutase